MPSIWFNISFACTLKYRKKIIRRHMNRKKEQKKKKCWNWIRLQNNVTYVFYRSHEEYFVTKISMVSSYNELLSIIYGSWGKSNCIDFCFWIYKKLWVQTKYRYMCITFFGMICLNENEWETIDGYISILDYKYMNMYMYCRYAKYYTANSASINTAHIHWIILFFFSIRY